MAGAQTTKHKQIQVSTRDMEYIECKSYNTFYPFQNKHHKSIGIYNLLRCFVLLKINIECVMNELG